MTTDNADLPLAGLLVVDMSQFLSGPYASLRLMDLGARVIKIERPDGGDLSRRLYLSDTEIGGDSTIFHAINRAKESLAIDLKSASDLASLRTLLGKADVLIQNFRPGVIKRLVLHIGMDAGQKAPPVHYLHQLYTASLATYTGKVSVPVLWDRQEGQIVNNESADIIRILNSAFDGLTGDRRDFYPEGLRPEIERWNGLIYDNINNGVYRAGFAKSQASYDEAVRDVFAALDRVEMHLADHRYLAGHYLTEADWRLFVTLVRFDAAYNGVFKCNIRRLEDYHHLSHYLRELYQFENVRDTVKIDHIKAGYYSIASVNPAGIVPAGPLIDFDRPHDRERLTGKGIAMR